MAERKYQDVEKLLEQNPGMTIPEAGRQLGYEQELQNKGQGRVGLRNRQVDQVRVKAEAIQRGEAPRYKPPKVPGFQQHHKRMIMLYRPLFEGLSDADALELSKYAAAQGLDLGDVESNFELLSIDHHNKIHRYMEQQGMRPSYMPDFSKADLANRKKAFDVLYKDFIQADIDKTTSLLIEKGSIRLKRAQMTALAGAGLAGVSMLGTAASAAETVGRGQIAAETKDPMDIVQTGLSGLSLAGDVVPVVGEVVSTPADLLNMAIDRRRERATEAEAYKQTSQILEKNPYKPAQTTDGSIPELVQTEKSALEKITSDPLNELEYAGKQILGGLKTVGGAILFGF